MKKYSYRFKTEQEFIQEFGQQWKNIIMFGWNVKMNKFFGAILPYEPTPEQLLKKSNKDPLTFLDEYYNWTISWDMVKLNSPDYKPKNKNLRII